MSNRRINIAALDLSFARAATVLARRPERGPVTVVLVGGGGTGSYMAMHTGRLLVALTERGTPARAVLFDHDRVEPKNVGRQLFCRAEVGRDKAAALAFRYGAAWGLDFSARAERFKASSLKRDQDELVVLVGCVDNAAARREMAHALTTNMPGRAPDVWWLDCGNHADAGQVLLGSAVTHEQMRGAFTSASLCSALPAPSVQSPELLVPTKAERAAKRMSCAELAAANLQSLNVNARVAAEASDMLTRLLLTRDLKRFACELNLVAGSMRSTYVTPEEVARVADTTTAHLMSKSREKAV
jgi:PRTRC genetic system ThiF family protein